MPCITTKMVFDGVSYISQVPGGPDTWNFVEIKLNNTIYEQTPAFPPVYTGFLPRCGSFKLITGQISMPNHSNPASTVTYYGRVISEQHTQPDPTKGTIYDGSGCTPLGPLNIEGIQVLPGDGLGMYISFNSLCYETTNPNFGSRQQKFISISPATFSLKAIPS